MPNGRAFPDQLERDLVRATAARPIARGGTRPPAALLVASRPAVVTNLLSGTAAAAMVGSLVTSFGEACTWDTTLRVVILAVDADVLPAEDPATALRSLRHRLGQVPVVVLDNDRGIRWCTAGATAVLPAQASAAACGGQMRALSAMVSPGEIRDVVHGPFTYDAGRRCIEWGGRSIGLSMTQVRLFLALMESGGELVPYRQLLRGLGEEQSRSMASLAAQRCRLRRQLEATAPGLSRVLITHRGEGWYLDLDRVPLHQPSQ